LICTEPLNSLFVDFKRYRCTVIFVRSSEFAGRFHSPTTLSQKALRGLHSSNRAKGNLVTASPKEEQRSHIVPLLSVYNIIPFLCYLHPSFGNPIPVQSEPHSSSLCFHTTDQQ